MKKGTSDYSAWRFVRNYLEQLPIVVTTDDGVGVVAERQGYLLFDRMVAFHIRHNLKVPLSAGAFLSRVTTAISRT